MTKRSFPFSVFTFPFSSVFYLIVLQLPLAEGLEGFVAHHAMDGDGTVFVWFLYLTVYKVIAKAYAVGILLGIAIEDGAHPCPVEGRQTHGARFARGVADAPFQFEVPHPLARLAYGTHLGMSRRIVVCRYAVCPCCHHLAILHYHGTEGSAPVLHILHAQVYRHLHEPAISIRYLCHRLSWSLVDRVKGTKKTKLHRHYIIDIYLHDKKITIFRYGNGRRTSVSYLFYPHPNSISPTQTYGIQLSQIGR